MEEVGKVIGNFREGPWARRSTRSGPGGCSRWTARDRGQGRIDRRQRADARAAQLRHRASPHPEVGRRAQARCAAGGARAHARAPLLPVGEAVGKGE
eukprot:4595587-Pyramimonas_sp.AAC.1